MILAKSKCFKGNVTAEGYKDCIRIDHAQFSVGRAVSMESGNISNREATRPTCSEMTLSMKADNSVTALFTEAVSGSQGQDWEILFLQTGTDSLDEYMKIELQKVILSGYSITCSGEEEPYLTVSLSYTEIMMNFSDFDSSNKAASPQRAGYSVEKGKKL